MSFARLRPQTWLTLLALLFGATMFVVVTAKPAYAQNANTTYFTIRNAYSGRCLDAAMGEINRNGTTVQLWDCTLANNQLWYMDGTFIRNSASGRCLDADGNNPGNGARIQLWDCHGGINHHWYTLNKNIRSYWTHRCIDAEMGSIHANGTRIQMFDCPIGTNQQWRMMGAVYFSPYGGGQFELNGAFGHRMARDEWVSPTACSTSKMPSVPTSYLGMRVETLAGWSLGRLGPLYYLLRYPERRGAIDRIVMIDPGNKHDLTGCDTFIDANKVLYEWLRDNPRARLDIYSGVRTAQDNHAGIQDIYFARIRQDPSIRWRVSVCNYGFTHEEMFHRFHQYVDKWPISGPHCPNGTHRYWNP